MGRESSALRLTTANPCVLASSAAFPKFSYTQEEVLEAVSRHNHFSAEALDFGKKVFAGTKIKRSNIALAPDQLGKRMDRETYRVHLHNTLRDMSVRACQSAILDWGGKVGEITHLIWATMSTVVDVPSMDCILVNDLDLESSVRRLAVQQMGCMSGFRCLNLAAEIAKNDPSARVLVCVADVRSGLQNQLPICNDGAFSKSAVVSCALFRDAASAVVIGSGIRTYERPKAEWLQGTSHIVKGTLDQVSSLDMNGCIYWANDKNMPALVSVETVKVLKRLVTGFEAEWAACNAQFVVHCGGPAILKGTQQVLALSDEQLEASWQFMAEHGNTSGSSNLAILHHELCQPRPAHCNHIVCLAGGPGVSIEGAFLRRLC